VTQAMHLVLAVEDEPSLRGVLRALFEAQNYRFAEASTAARAVIEARGRKPDIVLVDLGLPDGDGLGVIRQVRSWSALPIIVLSARTMEEQKIAAFDAGADDYVTKPFSAAELLARVRSALRRAARREDGSSALVLGSIRVDLARRESQGPDGYIHMTPLEYRVLECLAREAGLIVRQEQLIREVWGPDRLGGFAQSARVYQEPAQQARARSAPAKISADRGRAGLSAANR
jgi:two-component system KDP operon response regulator KdpE